MTEWKQATARGISTAQPTPDPHCEQSLFAQAEYVEADPTQTRDDPDEDSTEASRVIALYPELQRVNLPPETPDKYRGDYRKAILIKKISPKASAALSRRILQNIIQEELGIKHRSLAQEAEKEKRGSQ